MIVLHTRSVLHEGRETRTTREKNMSQLYVFIKLISVFFRRKFEVFYEGQIHATQTADFCISWGKHLRIERRQMWQQAPSVPGERRPLWQATGTWAADERQNLWQAKAHSVIGEMHSVAGEKRHLWQARSGLYGRQEAHSVAGEKRTLWQALILAG